MEDYWRPIPGVDHYSVSRDGRIKSEKRVVIRKNGVPMPVPEREIKIQVSVYGYKFFRYRVEGRLEMLFVHRAVLMAFDRLPREGEECRHLDGDKGNNHIDNLAWGTPKENGQDQIRHGTHANTFKTHCKRGHEFTTENTKITTKGSRQCLACVAILRRSKKWSS